jgi:cell envelope opacity-associated protein A
MPGRFELKPTLAKIWHAPDHFRIMDPLPPCIAEDHHWRADGDRLLLPSGAMIDTAPVTRNAQLEFSRKRAAA